MGNSFTPSGQQDVFSHTWFQQSALLCLQDQLDVQKSADESSQSKELNIIAC